MKAALPVIARVLMGFVFFAGGLTYFLNMYTPPTDLPEALMTFNKGLTASIYFMPFLKGVETVCGLLLLIGFFVPLALVVLAPILINIFLVHLLLAPSGLWLAIILGLLEIYLAFFSKYSPPIKNLFRK